MDIKEKIGKHLKILRTNKGLTQEKLSYESEVDKTYISEVENGKRNISVVNLEKLITTMGSTVKDFFFSTNGTVGSLKSLRILEKILSLSVVLAESRPLTFSITNTDGLCSAMIRRYSLYNPTLLSWSSSSTVSCLRDLPTKE